MNIAPRVADLTDNDSPTGFGLAVAGGFYAGRIAIEEKVGL